jgi:histidine triad (HIT) family protein
VWDIPDELGAELLAAQKSVGKALMDVTGAQGLNIGMNNFLAAGQLVMHAHYHLIPRFDDDGLTLWPGKSYESMDEMNALAETLCEMIA